MTKTQRVARALPVGGSAICGAIAALGHAPFDWPVFTVLGFAAAGFLILSASGARQAGLRAWTMGIGFFGVTLSWLVEPFMVDVARHGWMAPFALLFMAAGLALLWGVAVALGHRIAHPTWRWLALAVALTVAELVRERLFTGFPWGNPGQVWIDTPFAQLASVIGASGLGALTFLVATLVARIALLRGVLRLQLVHALALAGVIAALFALGFHLRPDTQPKDRDVTLRLVQPNAPQHLKWDPRFALDFVSRQVEYTAAPPLAGAPKPDLVIWPETAVPALLEWTEDLLDEMAVAAQGTPVLFGVQRGERPRFFNSLALLNSNGQIAATYDKHHLVPFGEYIPLGDFLTRFGISAFAAQAGNGYSAGPAPRVFDLGALGNVLPLICYEAVFPRDIRAAPERADWILHATNDAWFGEYSMPYQHLAQARFRAIEFGLPVIRVANTGISAVIDPSGDVRASIALGQSGFLDTSLPGSLPAPPFSRHGDLPLTLFVIVATGALAFRRNLKAR